MNALRSIDRVLAPLTLVVALFAVVCLFAGPGLFGAKGIALTTNTTTTKTQPSTANASAPDGKAVFAKAGCGGCHTLKAAGASGSVGPNLDDLKPNAATVAATVKSGAGSMPSFSGQLSDAEIQAVASFVAKSTGG